MKDPISDVDRPLDKPVRYLVPSPATWKDYTCCPWASSILVIDPETENLVLCPVTCKRWGCPYCAVRKIRKLAFLTNGAAPNRWIRLGVDPALYESPKDAWQKTAPKFPELFRRLRKIRDCEIEYLKVTELHKSGYPHYHALLRCGFLPKAQMDDTWSQLTGAANYNWISKIDSTFSSFRYLVKYLTKLHRLEWTDRHVSYSRNFFREEDREKLSFPERAIQERIEEHPWAWLSRRYYRETVGMDDNGCFHLDEAYIGTPVDLSDDDVGLTELRKRCPMTEDQKPAIEKLTQRRAFEDDESPSEREKAQHYLEASF